MFRRDSAYAVKADNGTRTVPDVAGIAKADADAGRIAFDMLTQYDVSDRDQNAPKTRWGIALTYTGDLPVNASRPAEPATTTIDAPSMPLERFLTPSLWEARVAAAFPAASPRTIAKTWLREAADLGACKLQPFGIDARVTGTGYATGAETLAFGQIYNLFWNVDDTADASVPSLDSAALTLTSNHGGAAVPPNYFGALPMHPMIQDMVELGRQAVGSNNMLSVRGVVNYDSVGMAFRPANIDFALNGTRGAPSQVRRAKQRDPMRARCRSGSHDL